MYFTIIICNVLLREQNIFYYLAQTLWKSDSLIRIYFFKCNSTFPFVAGLDAFKKFLKTEFSEENIEFWIACEDYKKSKSAHELLPKAKTIYETFIQKDAPKEVKTFLIIHRVWLTQLHLVKLLRSACPQAASKANPAVSWHKKTFIKVKTLEGAWTCLDWLPLSFPPFHLQLYIQCVTVSTKQCWYDNLHQN